LNDAEKVGPALTSDKPIDVGNDRKDLRDKRAPLTALSSPVRKSSAEKEIEGRMNQSVNLNFNNLPLKDVLEDIRAMYQINIVPDMAALEQEGISLDRPVTLKLEQISLKSALNLMLRNVHLTWVVKDEVLQITTEPGPRQDDHRHLPGDRPHPASGKPWQRLGHQHEPAHHPRYRHQW
jgi:type II secretory pathway component GspD/PulD (secretin)